MTTTKTPRLKTKAELFKEGWTQENERLLPPKNLHVYGGYVSVKQLNPELAPIFTAKFFEELASPVGVSLNTGHGYFWDKALFTDAPMQLAPLRWKTDDELLASGWVKGKNEGEIVLDSATLHLRFPKELREQKLDLAIVRYFTDPSGVEPIRLKRARYKGIILDYRMFAVVGMQLEVLQSKNWKSVCSCGKDKHGFLLHTDWCNLAYTNQRGFQYEAEPNFLYVPSIPRSQPLPRVGILIPQP